MNKIVIALIERDKIEYDEAVDIVRRAQYRVSGGENPETILQKEFNLGPEYAIDLL